MIPLKVKLLTANAKLPTKAYLGDAGWDLYATKACVIPKFDNTIADIDGEHELKTTTHEVDVGLAVEIPEGYFGMIADRSSLGKLGLRLHHGIIDSGYRGPISVFFQNFGKNPHVFQVGDKVAQLLILPVESGVASVVEDLTPSHRGEKGFGSSGK
jgi:dUTP pyrophosphatase